MTSVRRRFEYAQHLDPFPEGWFYVASRQDLRRAKSNPESTEGGRRVSVLKRQEGAPVLLG